MSMTCQNIFKACELRKGQIGYPVVIIGLMFVSSPNAYAGALTLSVAVFGD